MVSSYWYTEDLRDQEISDYVRLGDITQHVARKQHKCSHCRIPIKPGMKYWKTVGIFEGDFFEEKSHVHPEQWEIDCAELLGTFDLGKE